MKKNVLLFVGLLLTVSVNADAGKSVLLQSNYIVASDVFSNDVPEGKCVVTGFISQRGATYADGNPVLVVGGEISTLDRKKTSFSDENGNYKLLLDSKDTSIFFFKKELEEIVIWNYKFQSQHIVTINFFPGINQALMDVDKPVIYLYSENEINAEIKFSCKGDLTFTYPTYNDAWNVVVNGNQITASGKTYPYLFWEAEQKELEYFIHQSVSGVGEIQNQTMNGFLISTDSVVNFLENSLTALGLNSTEQTDFITFWAPRMISKPFALVQFLVGDDYAENISELTITPTPDALRRIFMVFTPLETNEIGIAVEPQEFVSFKRSGFTVVEWGGSEISISSLIP